MYLIEDLTYTIESNFTEFLVFLPQNEGNLKSITLKFQQFFLPTKIVSIKLFVLVAQKYFRKNNLSY